MATQWHALGDGNFALTGGSNIGVIVREGRAVMIDAGLDKDAAKKALRAIEGTNAQVAAIIITHGHADHFGGAGWLAQQAGIPVYASPLEATFATQPLLEPLFLYGGAAPIAELQGKFTLARQGVETITPLDTGSQEIAGIPLEIISLPGHAPQQIGVAAVDGVAGDTCYCGDVVFPEETLARHPILFCADMDAWLATLKRLPALPYVWYVPGHGEPVQAIAPLAERNTARLQEIRARVWESLETPQEAQDVLRIVAAHYGITFAAPQFYLLALTTIHAALTSLQTAGETAVEIADNQMVWRRA
jgi:glyoxylase-like metal-dependent hydrolase (beta-lactamase superfamily II)